MPNEDEIMALDKHIGRLEETVAKEFFDIKRRFERLEATVTKGLAEHNTRFDRLEASVTKGHATHNSRFDRLEDRLASLDSKFDIVSETVRGDIKEFAAEMRRTTEAIRKEHEADRRLTRTILNDHVTRIRTFEGGGV